MAHEPPEVTWLRRYSSYLAPKVGLLSLDSLTLFTIWSRNFFLNLIVLLGFLVCVFLIPYELLTVFDLFKHYLGATGFAAALTGTIFLWAIGLNLWHQDLPRNDRRDWFISARGVGVTVVVPGVLAACLGSVWLLGGDHKTGSDLRLGLCFVSCLLVALLVLWIAMQAWKTHSPSTVCVEATGWKTLAPRVLCAAAKSWWRLVPSIGPEAFMYTIAGPVALAICTAALVALDRIWAASKAPEPAAQLANLLVLGPPAVLLVFGIGTTVFTGIVGRVFYERSREWWSRLNACS